LHWLYLANNGIRLS